MHMPYYEIGVNLITISSEIPFLLRMMKIGKIFHRHPSVVMIMIKFMTAR